MPTMTNSAKTEPGHGFCGFVASSTQIDGTLEHIGDKYVLRPDHKEQSVAKSVASCMGALLYKQVCCCSHKMMLKLGKKKLQS